MWSYRAGELCPGSGRKGPLPVRVLFAVSKAELFPATLNSLWPPFGSGHVSTVQCSNSGFSLLVPSLAPKAMPRTAACCVTLIRAGDQGGLTAGTAQSNSSSLLCTLVLITVN